MNAPAPCCESFKSATLDETGNEYHDPLIRWFKDAWMTSCGSLNFCPWCGKSLKAEPAALYFRCKLTGTTWKFHGSRQFVRASTGKKWQKSMLTVAEMKRDEEITAEEGEP